ncbi:hypothetical protein GUJ93_ZPchr0013g36023 [Zizania palustris]|uniref:Uncharacterized protein n=1 Tax=Zizania palustris TaxID=103762 RepID=A0A8J5X562_ZIZPA|nr:hypothetical protein GUJ93_ZPchr0013g36023 [Zizania palustris]
MPPPEHPPPSSHRVAAQLGRGWAIRRRQRPLLPAATGASFLAPPLMATRDPSFLVPPHLTVIRKKKGSP